MNDVVALVQRLAEKLDDAGIPYMVSGSLASSAWGDPRASYDVDIVIAPTGAQLSAFLASLGDAFYVSAPAATEALRTRTAFNVIEHATGAKADFIIRKERPFSVEEFNRRRRGRVEDAEITLVSPEDSILSKLEWSKKSGSDRHYRDALGVAALQQDKLDVDYLRRWARELDVSDLVERLLHEMHRTG
ncbi:MAG TPA: hypothetical protein VMX57_08175 [Planctomycetota bacterium]|nr:hypothetical protein [Planctomycetota bacterium]